MPLVLVAAWRADWSRFRESEPVNVFLGAVASLIVANRSQYIEGDHVILVGEVVTYDAPGGAPLVFHDGRYIASATEEPLPRAFSRKPWR